MQKTKKIRRVGKNPGYGVVCTNVLKQRRSHTFCHSFIHSLLATILGRPSTTRNRLLLPSSTPPPSHQSPHHHPGSPLPNPYLQTSLPATSETSTTFEAQKQTTYRLVRHALLSLSSLTPSEAYTLVRLLPLLFKPISHCISLIIHTRPVTRPVGKHNINTTYKTTRLST